MVRCVDDMAKCNVFVQLLYYLLFWVGNLSVLFCGGKSGTGILVRKSHEKWTTFLRYRKMEQLFFHVFFRLSLYFSNLHTFLYRRRILQFAFFRARIPGKSCKDSKQEVMYEFIK